MRRPIIGVLVTAAGLAACGDAGAPAGTGTVSLQLASKTSGVAAHVADAPRLSARTTTLGGATLTLASVQVVVRKLKLERDDAACPDEVVEGEADDARCPDFRAGPFLLDVPLDEGAVPEFSGPVPAGTYDALKFQVHRPTARPADRQFLQANPTFAGVSIRVTGTYQPSEEATPQPFTWTTDKTFVQQVDLNPALVVDEGTEATPVTLLVDVSRWFQTAGGVLIDPGTAQGPGLARAQVENSIRFSFKAFRDRNRDGRQDD